MDYQCSYDLQQICKGKKLKLAGYFQSLLFSFNSLFLRTFIDFGRKPSPIIRTMSEILSLGRTKIEATLFVKAVLCSRLDKQHIHAY